MMTRLLAAPMILVMMMLASVASADEAKPAREFPVSLPAAKAALQNLGAYTGGRLPSLDGFVKEQVDLKLYQRPYYEFKIDLEPVTPSRTRVVVKANVSVWYEGPEGPPGYRSLQSNGRLEADLFDRLQEYLRDKSDDPKVLSQTVEDLRRQRTETEAQVATLKQEVEKLQKGDAVGQGSEFVSVPRPVAVLSAPAANAKMLLRAQPEDEFQLRGRRGEWLEIALADGRTGWLKQAQVRADAAMQVATQSTAVTSIPGFTVIREAANDFSGDWPRLRSKRALYVWARPDGSALNVGTGDRLAFVERVFTDRYREITHGSGDPVDGVVIIFLDQRGGVAAAALDDIRLWVEGSITAATFLKKCSLDPPSSFQDATTAPVNKGKQHKVSYRTADVDSHPL